MGNDKKGKNGKGNTPESTASPVNNDNNCVSSQSAVPEVMDLTSAVELVKGLETARERWKSFDKWVSASVDKQSGIIKESIIKAVIIKAQLSDIDCPAMDKTTVNGVLSGLSEEVQRLINRKHASIKALVSMAYNNEPTRAKKSGSSAENGKGESSEDSTPKTITFGDMEANITASLSTFTDDQLYTLFTAVKSEIDRRQAEKTSEKKAA